MRTTSLQTLNQSSLLTERAPLTSRRAKASLPASIDISQYLISVQQVSRQREVDKRAFQQFFHRQNRSMKAQSPTFTQSKSNLHTQESMVLRKNGGRFRSQKSITLKQQQVHQELYNDTNQEKIAELNEQIREMVSNLVTLRDKLNNQRKLYYMVKKAVGQRKLLAKMLLQPELERIADHLNVMALRQGIVIKEHIPEGQFGFEIDTYNFAIIKDIQALNEKLHELIVQTEINGIYQIHNSIELQMHRFEQELKQTPAKPLQFQTITMMRGPLNDQLASMERRLGMFPLITGRNKELDYQLSNVIHSLNRRFKRKS